MRNKAKLYIYKSEDLTSPRDTKDMNSDLEREYNSSIFDFAYLLTIALNDEFLPMYRKRSYFGNWEELKRYKSVLENTKKKLPDKPFFKRLLLIIDEYLKDITIGLMVTRRPSGPPLGKKAKLVLLWTYLLRKGKTVSGNATHSEGRLGDETKGVLRTVNWNDFFVLLTWFHLKLKDCSYSFLIRPKQDMKKEKVSSKALLEKHFDIENNTKNWYYARKRIWLYIELQQFLKEDRISLSNKKKRLEFLNIKPYPIIQVKFNKDSIEIGELRENEIVMQKYSSIEKKKVRFHEELIKKKLSPYSPTVVFPDGDIFSADNYMPPFYRYRTSLLDELLNEIRKS